MTTTAHPQPEALAIQTRTDIHGVRTSERTARAVGVAPRAHTQSQRAGASNGRARLIKRTASSSRRRAARDARRQAEQEHRQLVQEASKQPAAQGGGGRKTARTASSLAATTAAESNRHRRGGSGGRRRGRMLHWIGSAKGRWDQRANWNAAVRGLCCHAREAPRRSDDTRLCTSSCKAVRYWRQLVAAKAATSRF